ncbi:MAG TPA: GDSL-type esterase/lipase family protein [Acidobacteriaceae bacterium]
MTRSLRLTAAFICCLLPAAAFAQNAAPASVPAPLAPAGTIQAAPVTPPLALPHLAEPASRPTVPDLTRYLNNPALLNFCTAQVAQFNDRDADIIFIGDSITQGWLGKGKEVWEANFAARNALDFGIGGDQTQHVLWRMDNYPIQRLHPKVAVVLIGTNNLHNTAPEIAEGVKAVLTKTQTMYPGIRTILVSIMPNRRANDLMMAANAILRTFADDQTIYYLDLVPVMTPVGDNWKGLGPDHLHPDASGYQLWTDAMLPLLNKLLPLAQAATQ